MDGAEGTHKGCPYTGQSIHTPQHRFTPMRSFLQYEARGLTRPSQPDPTTCACGLAATCDLAVARDSRLCGNDGTGLRDFSASLEMTDAMSIHGDALCCRAGRGA